MANEILLKIMKIFQTGDSDFNKYIRIEDNVFWFGNLFCVHNNGGILKIYVSEELTDQSCQTIMKRLLLNDIDLERFLILKFDKRCSIIRAYIDVEEIRKKINDLGD